MSDAPPADEPVCRDCPLPATFGIRHLGGKPIRFCDLHSVAYLEAQHQSFMAVTNYRKTQGGDNQGT